MKRKKRPIHLTRRMDTPERRQFWRELDEIAKEAKRLPGWMRGKRKA